MSPPTPPIQMRNTRIFSDKIDEVTAVRDVSSRERQVRCMPPHYPHTLEIRGYIQEFPCRSIYYIVGAVYTDLENPIMYPLCLVTTNRPPEQTHRLNGTWKTSIKRRHGRPLEEKKPLRHLSTSSTYDRKVNHTTWCD